ncbi:hypothetical protein A2Y83_00635 [Candidatus Falkowbacteria bacterium RBG_13_39_14]|uniref:UDP-N-acetylglucosamine pyrophosphorylase n=1 Tax=Candidatus Falkowbacteria bacterium RBG_13_39_14 TaxID=1797985 RepID=A0A1F5S9S6_9BACT|nr:MAG: hypothetical protein A2Y83_00635 [Candidatus Falkowbacteria bacterium RBG_13_39_14]
MQKLSKSPELLKKLQNAGVEIIDPDFIFIEGNVEIGEGSIIYPQVFLSDVKIGKNSKIGPVAEVIKSFVGDNAEILFGAQMKRSVVGNNFKMHHHSYIGDAELGDNINYGAGAITCNYDGINKYKTEISDDVFIGTNVNLIAPIKIGKGCFIAAGSTLKSGLETGEGNLIVCREKDVYVRKKELRIEK